jgi:Na+-translocating ferredoxin:NAD+ oxidoreductase RnfG subunit
MMNVYNNPNNNFLLATKGGVHPLKPLVWFIIIIAIWGVALHAAPIPKKSERIYATLPEALYQVFPNSTRVVSKNVSLSSSDRRWIGSQLRMSFSSQSANDIVMYQGFNDQEGLGMAFIINEQGKYYPITIMIHITPTFELGDMVVMVYREKIGSGIRKRRFIKQFIGKTKEDPLMVSRDINGITGATISSWSVATAGKKALLLAHAYQKGQKKP